MRKRQARTPALVFILAVITMVFLWGCAETKLEKIQLTPEETTLSMGEAISFKAVALSNKGEEMPQIALQWSVEGDAGSVDTSGVFTALKPGKAFVIATGNGVSGKALVTVTPSALAALRVRPEKNAALPGSTIKVKIHGLTSENESAGYNEVFLSSPTEGASFSHEEMTLDASGEAEFAITLSPNPGINVIRLSCGDVSEEFQLEGTRIVRLEILPREAQFEAGQKIVFEALGFDPHGNQAVVDAEWSISSDSAAIKDASTVLMNEPGRGILLAEYQGITQGHPFSVVPGKIAKIEIEPPKADLHAGQNTNFSAKGFNAQGYSLPARVEWSVEGDVGVIAGDGTFLARMVGEGFVKASYEDVAAQAPIEVTHGPLADIIIQIDKQELIAGETIALSAMAADAYGNRFPTSAQWSLSRSIGTIDQQELTFTPLYTGKGEIRASVGNIVSSVGVEVFPAELARLQIAPQTVDMVAGEEVRFEVQGFDRFGNRVDVVSEISMDEPLGELSTAGIFKATKSGSTVVRTRLGELTAQSALAVAPAEMVQAAIEPEGPVELAAGKAHEFKAFGSDRFGNAVESAIEWSLHPDLGFMDDQGILFPRKAGKGEVVASLIQIRTGKKLEAKAVVSVMPGETTRIDIQPSRIQVTAGRETTFFATTYDQFGNQTSVTPTWTLTEPSLGPISESGLFNAVKAGSAKVVARHENVTADADVQVIAAEVAYLKIVPEEMSLMAGEKIQLKALGEDRFGNVVDARVVWSLSDPSLGSISSDHVFTAQKQGRGYVTAASRNIVDLAPVEVKAGPMVTIQIQPDDLTVEAGKKVSFEAIGLDVSGNPLEIQPEWSVDEPLGLIEQNGDFTAGKVGTGKLTASFDGVQGTAQIKVQPGPPATIKVDPQEITIAAGRRQPISYEVYDANENLTPQPDVRWEVEKGLGIIVDANEFHAQKAGQEVIRITAGNVTVQVPTTIHVGKTHVIHIEPAEADLTAGETITFTAKAFDIEGNDVPITANWAIGGGIGTITEEGVFQAVKVGSGHVSLQMDGVIGLCPIHVQAGSMARIAVTPEHVNARAGEIIRFSARAMDAQGNIIPAEIAWSLEPEDSGHAISPEGTFELIRAGETTVVATADNVRGEAEVRIEADTLTQLILSPDQINLKAGESMAVAVDGRDVHGNAVTASPQWEVIPPELGTFTQAGTFRAQKPGEGRLIASDREARATIPVEVQRGEIHRLTVELPHENIMAGKTFQFTAGGFDKGGNEVPVEVNWAVTEGIGKIDLTSGVFHATKAGTGMVVAYGHGLVAEKSVEVMPGELHRLFIEPNPIEVPSNTTQSFEVSGFDIEENAIPLAVSALSWEQVGGIGVFEEPGVFRGTRMGRGKVTAGLNELVAEAYVTVTPGKPHTESSRVRIIHPILTSDGEAYSEIIVEVRDQYNNPVPGAQARLVSNRQVDTIVQPPPTNEQGLTRGRISSSQAGVSIVSAVIQGETIRSTARVTFE